MPIRPKPTRIEHVVDGVRLRAQLSAAAGACLHEEQALRREALRLLHGALFRGRMIAKERLEAGENGYAVSRLLAKVADQVISTLFDFTTTHVIRARNPTAAERFAVLAVGGFGRGELAPSSDIDLLFLRAYKQTPYTESVTEYVLYMLWDMGLKVGHASRSMSECLKLARADHTIQTAILESRGVCGDQTLVEELQSRFREEVVAADQGEFIVAKLVEREDRHRRAGASRYMVEPNVKEGKGGLRDLHTLFWMARHRYGPMTAQEFVAAGVFTAEEWSAVRRAQEFLSTVRCHLHFLTGRAEERISFDLQPELAKRMGYGGRGQQQAVERFMKRYFLVVREVGALSNSLAAKLESPERPNPKVRPHRAARETAIEPGFFLEQGRVSVESPAVLDDPTGLFRLFELADHRALEIHPTALGLAARAAKRLGPAARKDKRARAAFLNLVASKHHPAEALARMNETGVLGRFVPEFGRIVAQMQFNMYHHYTVDEHTLKAIDYLSQIEKGAHKNIHPLSTAIFPKIINRRALYLALLLHDTGKGVGDQQIEGQKSAVAASERLGLSADETELVGWLVRHHLDMSDFAQKRDIADPRTITQFADLVGSVERLRLLLVLTVADIRAVGPGVWNDWKGQLLRDLYRATEAVLHGGKSDENAVRSRLSDIAAEAKTELLKSLGRYALGALEDWFIAVDDGYWITHDHEALVWHAEEMLSAQEAKDVKVRAAARVRPDHGVTEVMVHARDRKGLFASLAAAISAQGGDIASARVHTAITGDAFDVFAVQSTDGRPFGADDPIALEHLLARLRDAAVTDCAPPPPRPASRRTAAFAIEPWVRVDNEHAVHATIVEASGRDRPGLLSELARVFSTSGMSIVSAHIGAQGERVADVFYVQSDGAKVLDDARLEALQAELGFVLRQGEPAAPADPAKNPLAVARASTAR